MKFINMCLCFQAFELQVGGYTVHGKCLPKENQHTHKATGLMIWESAFALGGILAANPGVLAGKTVLEVGCGCAGICSLIASHHAVRVIATDGDEGTVNLLQENLLLNADVFPVDKIVCQKLRWGDSDDLEAVMGSEAARRGIDVVIGTDVLYVSEAVPLLFQTASSVLASDDGSVEPLLILCHIIRRVDEAEILRAAAAHEFELKGVFSSEDSIGSNAKHSDTKVQYLSAMFQKELDSSLSASSKALRLLCFTRKVAR